MNTENLVPKSNPITPVTVIIRMKMSFTRLNNFEITGIGIGLLHGTNLYFLTVTLILINYLSTNTTSNSIRTRRNLQDLPLDVFGDLPKDLQVVYWECQG